MNNRPTAPGANDNLSLLVNAASAEGRGGADPSQMQRFTLEEQALLLQNQQQQQHQQQQAQFYGAAPGAASTGLLSQLRDQNLLQQLGGAGAAGGAAAANQQAQLASLLGLGGAAGHAGGPSAAAAMAAAQQPAAADIRSALAAQLRQQQQHPPAPQQPQLSHADILALSRSGALGAGAASSLFGAAGAPGVPGSAAAAAAQVAAAAAGNPTGGLASELESLQRLEEIERRQRLMGAAPLMAAAAAREAGVQGAQQAAAAAAAARGGPVIRDERIPGGHIPRPPVGVNMDSSQSSKKEQHHPPQPGPNPAALVMSAGEDVAVQGVPTGAPAGVMPGMGPSAVAAATGGGGGPVGGGGEPANKEELEKTPGSVIVPCRARGMPMDHNFKTAYFVIPENVKHGEELICSYFACRNAGIKFRYCSHCKVPVAKRNFRKRHKHGGEDVAPLQGDGDDSGAEEDVGGKRGIPTQITATKRSNIDADALSSNSAESNEKEEVPQQSMVRSSLPQMNGNVPHGAEVASAPITTPSAIAMQHINGNPKISPERMNRWASLLGRRPATKEGDMMSAWLMEVLAVSDLDSPLKSIEELNLKPKSENAKSGEEALKAVSLMSAAAERVASAAAAATAEEEVKKAASAAAASSPAAKDNGIASVVKKKRPADLLQGDFTAPGGGSPDNTFANGSFAAWKERKKQKKQAKMVSATQEAEV